MDQLQTDSLRNNRVNIVQDLEPKGTVLDVLYEDGVLTENDVELVTSAKTRKERVQTLLSILPTRGPVAYGSFQKALEVGQYEDLAKLLNLFDQLNEIPVTNQNTTGVCKPCGKFLEWMKNSRNVKKNVKLKSILRYKPCLFLDNIEPTDVIDQLFQDLVIDTDDIDRIKSYTTRRERCETLFKCLLDNLNDSVVSTLKVALVKKYSYIADEISQSEFESETHTQSNETARKVADTTITTGVHLETRPKVFIDYSSDKNEIHVLRELDHRSASTFGETEDISIASSVKTQNCELGTCSREIGHSMSPNLNVNVTSELKTRDIHKRTIDEDHAHSNRLLNLKSTEHIMLHRDSSLSNINCRGEIDEHNARAILVNSETENAGKHFDSVVNVVGFKGKLENVVKRRDIEERSASTLGYVLSENSEPKAIVNQLSNGNTTTKDIEKQSDNTHRKQINLNGANQLKIVKHAEIREIEERTASMFSSYSDHSINRCDETEVKQIVETERNNLLKDNDEQTRLKNQYFDCVDSAFSERRLKVITIEDSLQPSKYELVKQSDNNNQDSTSCLACNSLDRDRVGALETKRVSSSDNDAVQKIQPRTEILPLSVTATHTERPRKRLAVAFNYLSTLINQGEFDKFKSLSVRLKKQFPTNYDLMCIIGYLQTSRDLFQTNFDAAKRNIDATMALVPKTSNPRYFTLEMFTAKTRMYITRKKLEKLQTTLDEAMMILETDPAGCTGRAAGWLYINHARNQTAQLSCLNLRKTSALGTYERLFQSAKTSFQRSMSNFKRDGGKDGPFGFGYALCRLVILLLRCGDNGLTMNILSPSADDLRSAGQCIEHLEDSDIAIPKILDMHFRLAKCDYQFRRKNNIRAHEHAEIAYDLATEMDLLEFKEHAHNRLSYLRSNTSCITSAQEMSGEEAEDILFGESTDNDYNTHSD